MKKHVIQLLTAAVLLSGSVSAKGASLLEVYEDAVANDPQLRGAEAAFLAVQTLEAQSLAAVRPQISLGADAGRSRTNPSGASARSVTSTGYTLSLRQPLFNREAVVAMRQAESRIAQGQTEFAAVHQEVIVRTARAYFDLLAALDNLEFARTEKVAVEQQLRQTRQRYDVGLTAITDVHEAQARFDLVVAQEIVAGNRVETAREALRQITGRGYETLAELRDEIPMVVPEPADIDAWVEAALEQNLQLEASRSAVEASRHEIDRRKAARWPNVNAVASHSSVERSGTLDPNTPSEVDTLSFSVQLQVPLYTGGLTTARGREAAYLHDQAQANLDTQQRATIRQTRDAFQAVSAGISQVQALQQFVTSAETALRATEAGFEVGTRTAVEVLDAQRELFRARRDFSEARYNYAMGTLMLKQAAGTLSSEDVVQISSWLH